MRIIAFFLLSFVSLYSHADCDMVGLGRFICSYHLSCQQRSWNAVENLKIDFVENTPFFQDEGSLGQTKTGDLSYAFSSKPDYCSPPTRLCGEPENPVQVTHSTSEGIYLAKRGYSTAETLIWMVDNTTQTTNFMVGLVPSNKAGTIFSVDKLIVNGVTRVNTGAPNQWVCRMTP